MKPAKPAQKAKTHQNGAPKTALEATKGSAEGKDKQEKRKVGAPSKRTPELVATVLAGISNGKSTRAMCAEVEITRETWFEWLAADSQLSDQYARAKDMSADYHAEGLIEIADERAEVKIEDGKVFVDPQFAQLQRLRFDARKWYASKLAPKKYGDRVDVDHGLQAGSTLETLLMKVVDGGNSRISGGS